MTAEQALKAQIQRYREMTGEERPAIALRLHGLACNVSRAGIRHQNPQADEAELERLPRKRIELSRGS
jgi:hypothetical protein